MNGGYIMVDCIGLDLTETDPQSISGIWNKAVEAVKADKPIVAYNCEYGTGVKVSPVTCFGWYINDDDTATVLDVASN